jgi:hypothetical protein
MVSLLSIANVPLGVCKSPARLSRKEEGRKEEGGRRKEGGGRRRRYLSSQKFSWWCKQS